ncbi:MAG: tetratricopeptide repeat protein, partial [Bacteroidota bacterium]
SGPVLGVLGRKAIHLLEEKSKLVSKTNLFVFFLKAASCHVQLGAFQEAEEAFTRCLELTEEEVHNWYVVKETYLGSLYRSGQYQKAFEVFQDAIHRPGFKKLSVPFVEQWSVQEAFLHYFISIGKIKPSLKQTESVGKFRLNKFLNDVPNFSKDKRGMNISILILQTLFLIQQKRFEDVNERLNALKAYSHRYLRKDDTFRSNCFIHMLLQLPHAYFNRKAAERKAKKFADQLSAAPLAAANQSGELELVPYEDLWQFVLSSLKG